MPAGVPIRVLAALNKGDIYRKPNIGMFEVVEGVYRENGYEIDLDNSVFVGDAAGRLGGRGVLKDHGDTDYKFAFNVGLKFLTPEVRIWMLGPSRDPESSPSADGRSTFSETLGRPTPSRRMDFTRRNSDPWPCVRDSSEYAGCS